MSPRDIEVAIEAVVPLAARCKVEIEWRDKELAALRSRVEEGERDTARIDYLQKSNIRWGRDYWASFVSNFPDLRSGIDAAMAATPEPKENARG